MSQIAPAITSATISRIPPDPVRIIIERVASAFRIPPHEIMERRNLHVFCQARRVCWTLTRRRGWSTTKIGTRFNRDHTTILYGLACAKDDIAAGAYPDPDGLLADDWLEWSPRRPPPPAVQRLPRKITPLKLTWERKTNPLPDKVMTILATGRDFTYVTLRDYCSSNLQAKKIIRSLSANSRISYAASARAEEHPLYWRLTNKGRAWLAVERDAQ